MVFFSTPGSKPISYLEDSLDRTFQVRNADYDEANGCKNEAKSKQRREVVLLAERRVKCLSTKLGNTLDYHVSGEANAFFGVDIAVRHFSSHYSATVFSWAFYLAYKGMILFKGFR